MADGERPNFFELLELDPEVQDEAAIAARIGELRERWSRDLNQGSPKKRQRAEERLQLLKEAERVLADPAARRREAEELRQRRQQASRKVAGRLDEAVKLLADGGGVCSRAQLRQLLAEFGAHFAEAEIVARLRAAGVEPPGRTIRPPEVRIDDDDARKIRDDLDLLEEKDLYAFLGLPPDAHADALRRRAEELERQLHGAAKADHATTARRRLAVRARKLFVDAEAKRRYDNQVAFEILSPLDLQITLAGAGGSLTATQVATLVAQGRKYGVGEADVRAYVLEVAEEKGWRVELARSGAGAPAGGAEQGGRAENGAGRRQPAKEPPPEPSATASGEAASSPGAARGAPLPRWQDGDGLAFGVWRRRAAVVVVLLSAGAGALYAFGPTNLPANWPKTSTGGSSSAPPPAAPSPPPASNPVALSQGGVSSPPPAPLPTAPQAVEPKPPPGKPASAIANHAATHRQAPAVAPSMNSPPQLAVVAEGEPALETLVEDLLRRNLGRYDLSTLDRSGAPAVAGLVGSGLGSLLGGLDRAGIDVLVQVRLDPQGQRELSYLGRHQTVTVARLQVSAFLVSSRGSLGSWSGRVEYSANDAEERLNTALAPLVPPLADAVLDAWAAQQGTSGGTP